MSSSSDAAKRITEALACGAMALLLLTAFPYFPRFWYCGFALFVFLLALKYPTAGLYAALGAGAVPIAYHSFPLFMLYAAAVLLSLIPVMILEEGTRAVLLVFSAPLLAFVVIAGRHVPLEYLAVLIAPIWIEGLGCLWVSFAAWLGTVFLGSILNYRVFGSQLLAKAPAALLELRPAFKTPFYSLGWASEYLNFDYFLTSLGKAVQLFFYPLKMMFVLPAILIEGIFWMAGTYVCSLLLGNQTSFSRVAAFPAAAAVLCAGQWLAFRLAPDHIPFNLAHFAAGLFLMGVPAFILHRLQEPFGVDSLALPHDRAAAPERPKGGLKDLSLKETIMMQVLLKDHMESFSRELTLLNIDVAESGRIKKHEDPANVIYSFDCYHKFADGICINRGGTVLDRAGDGIIYAFDSPGEAVKAAAEIQQGLPAFNRNVSRLKNIFKVRIGVHTGQIIMDRGTERGKFFSNTVDISGHLQKEAPVGEVFISGATYRALEEEKKSFVFAKRLARDNIDVYRYAGFAGD